jgi:hypothetical protein
MANKGLVAWIVIFGMVVLFPFSSVQAQEETPENDANCVSCHEHQYYLYDSGKWFCLCDAPMHCVYCHGGRTDTYVKELAHEGLVLYPTRDHAARCQTCHTEDYMSRAVTFASVAGISSTPRSIITATPDQQDAALIEQQQTSLFFHLGQIEAWRQVLIGVLVLVFIAIAILSYRCWKADCLEKTQQKNSSTSAPIP